MTDSSTLDPAIAARLKRAADGLVPAIVQQHGTGEVLMLGWMDDEALARTLTTGRATYWSRSRQEYWVKGETSGHRQWVREVRLDCDGDALLVTVDQEGPACHTGDRSCFDADVLLPSSPAARARWLTRTGAVPSARPCWSGSPAAGLVAAGRLGDLGARGAACGGQRSVPAARRRRVRAPRAVALGAARRAGACCW